MIRDAASEMEGLVREEPDNFLVHRRVFTDPDIFELEMERIFYRHWVYVGHESELAAGGDYKATTIGRQPVIVTRDREDRRLYVLHNRCSHRGTLLLQKDSGNTRTIACPYHGWTYNARGDLVHVPSPEGYGEGFDMGALGLARVPRVDSYAGLIFASMSAEGPSLVEQLGDSRRYLDMLNCHGPLALGKLGVHKVGYHGNWKLQMDNNTDSYHVSILHSAWAEIHLRKTGVVGVPTSIHKGRIRSLGNGHGAMEPDPDPLEPGYDAGRDPWRPWQLSLFPNVSILTLPFFGPQLRVARPIRADRTEVWHYPFLFHAEQKKLERMRGYEYFYGPGGTANADDREMFERIQLGLQSAGREWLVLSRGLKAGSHDERGIRSDPYQGEAGQRGFYQNWKRLMAIA